ncbi:bestrophin-4-like [Cylas formicarius]|uniref:bestrophin-4-like n=1 Tax=Cylas formicarius TaxID=197179 RepID=UPI002958CE00|nr:bestrophin-4-like [Cylas formicarius]XP_060530677.1 bestrophin-4-like [Cylas formicarius]
MTVTYTSEVTASTGIGCFLKLLARWKGSIYKIVWADLIIFLGLYYVLNLTYLYALDGSSREYFVRVVTYCSKNANLIPLSFVLGFFVNIVYSRWWSQFTAIPYPDNLALLIGANIKGQDERARIVRRTIVRYVCVTFTITLTMMSPKVKKRFPTLNHFVDAGLLTKDEKKIIEDLDNEYPNYSKNWLPLAWAANITTRARHEGIIRDDLSVRSILDQINAFRTKCGEMLAYDWISVPLVYTQVVTIAVYSYFLITVIGAQFIDVETSSGLQNIMFSFPTMPVLEFFFYMGWLKVAETLINPFGEDDDDFEVVWMIDRHIQVCYLLVDKIHQDHPKLMKDYYWQQTAPDLLPFTVGSQQYMKEIPVQSAENLKVKKTDQDLVIPESTTRHSVQSKRSLWNIISNAFTKKTDYCRGYYLRKIAVDDNADVFDEINIYEEEGPNKIRIPLYQKSKCNENAEEFEKLRKERLDRHRDKLLKCIALLKAGNDGNTEKKLVYDIVR